MAALPSISSSALLPLLVLILVSSSCFISATSFSFSDHKPSTNPAGFSARLIHRDSPESPFYDPKLTDAERMRNAEERSMERYNHLTRRRPNGVRAPIAYRLLEYTVGFGVGTPLVDTHAAMDTASDITWIQCRPCDNCYSQERGVAIYDPRKSSSYDKYGCMDPICLGGNGLTCDRDGTFCSYHRRYYDNEQSQGVFSTEAFWFIDTSHRAGRIGVQLAFGCGHNNTAGRTTATPGVFGLNREHASFITQLDVKLFSHCFVPKVRKQTSLLRFGQDAIITGETIPIVEFGSSITDARYYVSLEGISVNNTKLNIPQGTFKLSAAGYGGVMIDTGSSDTNLGREAYDLLIEELVKQIKLTREFVSNFDLCYLTNGFRDLIHEIPDITLHFSGLDYVVQGWTTWTRVAIDNNIVCFMIKRAVDELTTIGAHQLQDVNVGYDLPRKLISLQNMDCRKVS